MPTQIERERKWLVKVPSSWSDFSELLDGVVDVKRIEQTYLKPEGNEQAVRLRKTQSGLLGDTEIEYHFNQKKPTGETGAHHETEYKISEKEYHKDLKDADPEKCTVEKIRFVFEWHDQEFELDLFKGHLKGLAILEMELDDMEQKIELPPFLSIIKEITKDKQFSNYNLANKKERVK
jgi:CYTH domain-containing protein